ncbi:hypothetical protein [Flavobacterium soyangense]|uniref:Uncharacterized protein n=1 Tax=Flavobacterium soyangense TaxID=2023265 RepID=A0A930XUD9_9FLAO|nr:hypothetical protein [Flavobacterium soyangense]MBF2708480.1 hypothetical protein [Flavobacterium soyangense]
MKNLGLFCLLLVCIALESCNKNQKDVKATLISSEKPVSVQCYKALYDNDTIDLKINTLKKEKITGNMVMKVFNRAKKIGKIAGEFHGDTLFVAYTFILEANKQITYKNPMAFLKRGNELILGNGEIETTMGASYFVKGKPIDFDNVKYKFTKVDCIDK